MNTANYSTGRILRLVATGALIVFGTAPLSSAQTVAVQVSSALDPAVPRAATVDSVVRQAESLFRQGQTALSQARESEAQIAFDGALDVFVTAQSSLGADSAFEPAYLALVGRIHAAEVGARSNRRFLPLSAHDAVPEPTAGTPKALAADPAAPAAISQPPVETKSRLAELGATIEQARPTDQERRSNEAVLGTEEIDLPIELNNQVLGAIDLYSGRYKEWFARALSRGLPHLPRIREILAEAGIPQDLAYVPIVESAFNPVALSRAKAKGLWQFIPSTGKQYGLKQDFYVDERSNMEKATLAAAQYLKKLYALFGDWNLALAGYNAGEGRVQRAIRKVGTNDFWALARTKSFRAETKNYVPLIHAAIVIAKSPQSYGIDVTPEEVTMAETIRVAGSYPISTVARCGSLDPQAIRALNPDLRRGMTPSSAFDLRVPHGFGEQISTCLSSERALNYTRHLVRKADTFSLIARMFGVSSAEIARVNGMSVTSRLQPGTELVVPRASRNVSRKAEVTSLSSGTGTTSYRIRKGDTLSHLAARHSTTVSAIKALNGLSSSRLSIGQVLVVSAQAAETLND